MSDLVVRTEAENYKPVLTIAEVHERQDMIRQYASAVMREGEDYGIIPGTGTRKVLLKPGAEKLVRIFGLTPRFTDVKIEEDWTGEAHGGEMFFAYTIKCSLYRHEVFMGDADGSCNSWEKKYRYIKTDRTCPACGVAAIMRTKEEWGGGWYCNKNRQGCGSKFAKGNKGIEDQQVGQVPDPDIADKVNTIRKMAEKRALVAACLIVVGASEFFTQDIETEHKPQERPQVTAARPAPPQRQEEAYEAEYVPQEPGMNSMLDRQQQAQDDYDVSQPLITIRKASLKLKARLDELGYVPPTVEHYKAIMRHIKPCLKPEQWTAVDFIDAAQSDDEALDYAIGKMRDFVPEAAGASNSAVVNAADMYQSPADKIRDSLKETANGVA